jgi:hypothetical protein
MSLLAELGTSLHLLGYKYSASTRLLLIHHLEVRNEASAAAVEAEQARFNELWFHGPHHQLLLDYCLAALDPVLVAPGH